MMICDWNLDQKLQFCGIIVDGLAAIGAIAAIFIALKANKQNRTEIAQAQAEIANSIKIQEQSKNLDMLEKRLEILKQIEMLKLPDYELDICLKKIAYNDIKISSIEMIILFNNDKNIISLYNSLFEHIEAMKAEINNLYNYFDHYYVLDGEGGGYVSLVLDSIKEFIDRIQRNPDDKQLRVEFENYCNDYSFTHNDVSYNYFEIADKIKDVRNEFEKNKGQLIECLRIFIEESIKPVKEM